MSDRLESLEALIASPGFQVFQDYVWAEWGPSGTRAQTELDKALDLTDNDAAASQARQIRAAQKVIVGLMRWPHEEVARLKRQVEKVEPTCSRRGGL